MLSQSVADRPTLRYGLAARPHESGNYVLFDPLAIGDAVVLSFFALEVAQRFEGALTPAEIALSLRDEFPEANVNAEIIAGLAGALDDAQLLDSPRLRERFSGPIRRPTCLGTYSPDPAQLRKQLAKLFTSPGGPGLPATNGSATGRALKAVLVPHMDYERGNITYGHGFRELIANSRAEVFVIIATSHYSPNRFTLSRQHFDTPLGLVETDLDYVDRIASHYGDGVFDDPLAHVPEHSIELEAVLLQYLLAERRPFKIVPLLTGPMADRVKKKSNPAEAADLARMVEALRAAETASGKSVCYIISGDLAHIGPKFDDRRKAAGPWLAESEKKDRTILKTLEAADPNAFFDAIAKEKNARRICGLSPTWLTLEAVRPKVGKVLHYQQYVDPEGSESVSFAAVGFYA